MLWPQALRLALPPYGDEVAGMIGTSALAGKVTLADVAGVAETIAAETFAAYAVFLSAAIIHLSLTGIAERAIGAAESGRASPG